MAIYQQRMVRHYDKNVRLQSYQLGKRVLHRVFQNIKELGARKLALGWEGPHEIRVVIRSGAYKLRTLDDCDIAHPWNVIHLKLYHS